MFCSNCGNQLAEGAKFCSVCGARVAPADEQSFRTIADIDFKEPEIAEPAAEPTIEAGEEPKEEPRRTHVSFDWSNVVDEPHKKEVPEIKSPWGDTGGIDEQELYAEMTSSTDKSRTMSFIDVLRAEKEEKEKAAADKSIEYTEVLEIGQDLRAFDEPPELHYAPLYEDVNEPVKTPFDRPETYSPEPAFEEEPRFETADAVNETGRKAQEEPVMEPEEPKLEVSRETIAQFDEYVKSFEKEAGIIRDEPRVEKPRGGGSMPKFELPDFLKKAGEKEEKEPVAEPEAEPAASADPDELFEEYEIRFDDEPAEEPTFEIPTVEGAEEQPAFEEPKYEDYNDGFDFVDDDIDTGTEDLYLDLESLRDETSAEAKPEPEADYEAGPKHGADGRFDEEPEDEEEPAAEEATEEAEEAVDEADLFREMVESSPKHTGMTIAEPADTQSEIDALKRRLAELTGVPYEEAPVEAEPEAVIEEEAPAGFEPEFEEEPADYGLYLEPEDTSDVDELFAGLTAASQPDEEPAVEAEPEVVIEEAEPEVEEEAVEAEPEVVIEEVAPVVEEVAPEEPEIVIEEIVPAVEAEPEVVIEEVAPVVEEVAPEEPEIVIEEAAPVVEEAAPEEPEVVIEEVAPVVEEVAPEEPEIVIEEIVPAVEAEPEVVIEEAAPVVEEVAPEEPEIVIEEIVPVVEAEPEVVIEEAAPVVEEVAPVVEEVAPVVEEEPVDNVPSDALSLEQLERDLFGEVPEGEVEETKKIDKFYTLYKKNEEFQRLLDEEYERLKSDGAEAEEALAGEKAKVAAAPAVEEVPAEDKKAYRQVEDETIYMSKEDVEKQISREVKAETKPASGGVFEVKADAAAPVEIEAAAASASPKKADKAAKKADKAAKKAEKAAKKAEKKAAKNKYDDVDAGSGVLTVLAVIIAIILVLLLAVIIIMTVAPDSGIGLWINEHIQNITSGIGAVYPGDGWFLL